ncbi:uncharacterized protein LOC124279223 [Haliotis rubra]|uniref:uncharacterized protein LOC124279223 n=1 Tax=Haliotis rubra TaxID=36100 RepID=UPI001EE51D2E|nr:uncharacterized protein LOC124279223 [Haliotis rubra]
MRGFQGDGMNTMRGFQGAGIHLVEKLKRSEQRRQKRLRYSPSDSQLEINRHHYFRYRRLSGDATKDTSKTVEWEEGIHEIKTKRPRSLPKNIFRIANGKRVSSPGKTHGQSTSPDQTSPTKSSPPKSLPTTKAQSQVTDQYKSLPPGLGNDALVPTSPGNGNLLDTPVFEHSVVELEEWKQTTLTGANIPFSPSDPRRNSLDKVGNTLDEPRGKWLRKYSLVKKEQSDDYFRQGTRSFSDSFTDSGQSYSSEVSNRSTVSESADDHVVFTPVYGCPVGCVRWAWDEVRHYVEEKVFYVGQLLNPYEEKEAIFVAEEALHP